MIFNRVRDVLGIGFIFMWNIGEGISIGKGLRNERKDCNRLWSLLASRQRNVRFEARCVRYFSRPSPNDAARGCAEDQNVIPSIANVFSFPISTSSKCREISGSGHSYLITTPYPLQLFPAFVWSYIKFSARFSFVLLKSLRFLVICLAFRMHLLLIQCLFLCRPRIFPSLFKHFQTI